MSSWLDLLPSSERMKIRKRMRNPEVYAKSRESIPSVEEIAEEMDRNEVLADLSFALETEPTLKDALKQAIAEDLKHMGPEGLLYAPNGIPEDLKAQLEQGIDVTVDTNSENSKDQLAVAPEGNVAEKLPIKFSLSDKYVSQFVQG